LLGHPATGRFFVNFGPRRTFIFGMPSISVRLLG
jgi:hypothetical protein